MNLENISWICQHINIFLHQKSRVLNLSEALPEDKAQPPVHRLSIAAQTRDSRPRTRRSYA